jgi:hypothetical protein
MNYLSKIMFLLGGAKRPRNTITKKITLQHYPF